MELRQLRYFVETARRRSITRAAAALHIVQPALTAQIKALEAELGTVLFHRSPRGVSLTDSGEAVLRDALAVLSAVDDLKRRHQAAPPAPRIVRVGIPNGLTRAFAAQLIARAQSEAGVAVEIIESMSGHLLEWLKAGRLEIGVLFAVQPLRSLDVRALSTDTINLVGPPRALDFSAPVEFEQLGGYPLILPSAKHGLTRLIEGQARRARTPLTRRATLDSVAEIKHLVSQGVGYTLLARMAYQTEFEQGLLSAAPLRNPVFTRDLVTATRRQQEASDDVLRVRELVHEVCGSGAQALFTPR